MENDKEVCKEFKEVSGGLFKWTNMETMYGRKHWEELDVTKSIGLGLISPWLFKAAAEAFCL